jgi:putative hydrolase of the HAD superfamily
MPPHIANIVFDIGNVLYAYDPILLIQKILGPTPYESLFLEHLFHAPLWQSLDRGDLSESDALNQLQGICSDVAFVSGCRQLLTHFSCHLEPIPETHQVLADLAAHYPVYLLTNFQSEPYKRLFALSPVLPLSKGAIVSADEVCMKPEPQIYDLLLARFGLRPEQTLFIDDMPANIMAARDKGIHAVHLTDPARLRGDLQFYNLKGL